MYFDQSATHPINKKVLEETFSSIDCFFNSNSKHYKGTQAKQLIKEAEDTFLDFFNLPKGKITFTSGASESNNMVLLGIGQNHSKGTIFISPFEHSSVRKPISYLQYLGHRVRVVPVDKQGLVMIDQLMNKITEDTFLISIAACESEIGITQDITSIVHAIKSKYPDIIIHSDITQAINKYKLPLTQIDFASFSGHKFGSLKGIGGIIHNTKVDLKAIMYGSDLKPGTKPVELIHNMKLALRDVNYDDNFKIKRLNTYLRKRLENIPLIHINTPKDASSYILNLSILNHPAKVSQALLSKNNIYVSTQSACANTSHSDSVLKLSHSIKAAETSIRISLSPEHTFRDINLLLINLERLCQS